MRAGILLFTLLQISSALAAPPACETRYAFLGEGAVRFSIGEKDADRVFQFDRKNWDQGIGDGKKFSQIVRALENGATVDAETLAYLKAVRKFANQLRSEFLLLGKGAKLPPRFEVFVKELGYLNDRVEFNATALIPKMAKKVRKDFDLPEIEAELTRFRPAKRKEIANQAEKFRSRIFALMKKNQPSEDEFHEIRKLMKHYLALYKALQGLEPSAATEAAYQHLYQLNEDLGALRQDTLAEELASEKGEKLEHPQEIPPHLRAAIVDFLDRLEIVR